MKGESQQTTVPPLTPRQCHELSLRHSNIDIRVERSQVRCYGDGDFSNFGIGVQDKIDNCDLLMGIKEVPIERLMPDKTYIFFSHTIKKQQRNKGLLKAILDKRITLIDYELLTDDRGMRLIGFGRWAGIVGAHYALLMLGERTGAYHLKPAIQCINLQETIDQYYELKFPKAKFLITGGGRVAQGALEIMQHAGIEEVSKADFLLKEFAGPVFVQLHSEDLYQRKNGEPFDKQHFYRHAAEYETCFKPYFSKADVLLNCMFWDINAPVLFSPEEALSDAFRIKTIADITCDIPGSIPITLHETNSADPIYGYYPANNAIGTPYTKDCIDIMAVPNLPNELPRDASRDFGKIMMDTVIPHIMHYPDDPFIARATIAKAGKLMPGFEYLEEWVNS